MAKIFLDSATILEIEEITTMGIVSGITTNPTFLKDQCNGNPLYHLKKIVAILKNQELLLPFSVQVMESSPSKIIQQAEWLSQNLNYKQLVIKIPIGWEELHVIRVLSNKGLTINCTSCITPLQANLAANAGAKYISIFFGKARDAGEDIETLIPRCMKSITNVNSACELIVGSLRNINDVQTAIIGGTDIVTIRLEILKEMSVNKKTIETKESFSRDFLPFN